MHEDDPNCSFEHHFYIPPGAGKCIVAGLIWMSLEDVCCAGVDIHTEETEGPLLRVDYFDTKKQVRDYVERIAAEAKAAKESAKRNKKNKKSAEPA